MKTKLFTLFLVLLTSRMMVHSAQMWPIIMDNQTFKTCRQYVVNDFRPDGVNNHLDIWMNTYLEGAATGQNFNGNHDGYLSLLVGDQGWSGMGVYITNATSILAIEALKNAIVADPSNYYLHLAIKSTTQGSHEFYTFRSEETAFNIGTSVVNQGAIIADFPRDGEWYDFYIPMSQFANAIASTNIISSDMSIFCALSGGTPGVELDLDAIYFCDSEMKNIMPSGLNVMSRGLYFSIDKSNGTANVISCVDNLSGNVVIPETIIYDGNTYIVTRIAKGAFQNCTNLTSLTLPNSIVEIGSGAINGSNITDIYVPCGELERFQQMNYGHLMKYAPKRFDIIAHNGNVDVPKDITICNESALITAIPDRGFYFVKWADGNTDNPRAIELTQQDTDTIIAIFDYLLSGKCGKDNVLTWKFNPSTMALDITGKGALSENYTYGTFIESLTIGNEITSIGQSAFSRFENLKHITLGSSVKVLEYSAFAGCSAIETITCYSQRPPTVNEGALYGLDYSTIVYVPADYLETYKMHDAWGLYDVRAIGAASSDVTDVNVTPSDNSVDVAWPSVSGAASYELVIKDKNGNVICTLIFNANGQLTQIAFSAPSRDGAPQQKQGSGFSFTVTGLEQGTSYDLTITAKDENGTTLDEKKQSFHTDWATAIDEAANNEGVSRKILRDGQVLIKRSDKLYTLQGQQVK